MFDYQMVDVYLYTSIFVICSDQGAVPACLRETMQKTPKQILRSNGGTLIRSENQPK